MSAHGPALIAKAAKALVWDDGPGWRASYARAVLNAVADDLRAGALEEAAEQCDRHADECPEACRSAACAEDNRITATWLREQAAEIRAGAS